jgi:hypothetical protein
MKKIISYVLMLSLALTIIVSAMPSQQAISAQLGDKQMTRIVGGHQPACGENRDCPGGGGGWGCAGTLLGTGIVFIAEGATGPVGWGAFFATIGTGIAAISSACG